VTLKKFSKIIILSLSLMFALTLFTGVKVSADTPYKTFTQDGYGRFVETQTAYTPLTSIIKFGDLEFVGASDIKIGKDGLVYVSDTGNKRILVGTTDGKLVKVIGEGVLDTPKGIFVTEDGKVYAADEKKEKVFVFSKDGELLNEYSKPDSPLFGKGSVFKPQKLVVDKRGNIYVISQGNYNGIIQLSSSGKGNFLGYFGANPTKVTPLTIFRKAIFTEEQLSKMTKIIPATAANLTIDEKGLIYTVTQGDNLQTLKKLNMAGTNIIYPDVYDFFPAAVAAGPIDNIFVASKDGWIYEYNSEGSLLFLFGGTDDGRQRVGLFKAVSGIAIDSNQRVYVLDSEANKIEVFKKTEFTDIVHKSIELYQNGRYAESKGPWTEVLRMNSMFDYANLGMGEALYKEGNYKEALEAYRLAKYKPGYSDAFWEIRNVWMKENIIYIILGLFALYVLSKLVKFVDRKKKILKPFRSLRARLLSVKILRELNFIWYFIKHPIDGYYGIKREGKVSYLSANILIFIFLVIAMVNKYGSGFIFSTVREGRYNLGGDVLQLIAVFLMLVICNYLVCTINEGEGRFKDIYCGLVYSFAPYFMFKPFIIAASNVLTLNESFLLSFANFVVYAWVAILVVMMIKQINDYTLGETFKIIGLTIFTILIATLIIFIVYVLVSQVIDFITSIYREAVYRIENK
jgi:tetratricopeptide (TPR) repeat protein/sugar lactone lactonase YvrE